MVIKCEDAESTVLFVDPDLATILAGSGPRGGRLFRVAARVGAGSFVPRPSARRRYMTSQGEVVRVLAVGAVSARVCAVREAGGRCLREIGEAVLWEELQAV